MSTRVCILGAGFENKGAEAMLLTVADAVRRRIPDATIYARLPRLDFDAAKANGLHPLPTKEWGFFQRTISKVCTATMIARGTTLIDVSGFQFGDDWSHRIAERRARTVRQFTRSGNLVFFMPQAWGPFEKNALGAQATKNILQDATLSFVRDKASLRAVAGLIGEDLPKVKFAHDLAWNFTAGDSRQALERIRKAGIEPSADRPLVCVTPNLRVYERCPGTGTDNAHLKMLIAIIHHLCRHHRAQVIILGHELRQPGSKAKDDQFLGDLVFQGVDRSLPVAHLSGPLGAADIKAIIGRCDLVLSSRYHALIAALSQGIPVGVAGWSHKYTELLDEAGGGVTFSHDLPEDDTLARIDGLMQSRDDLRHQLAQRTPAIKENSRQMLDAVIEPITARC